LLKRSGLAALSRARIAGVALSSHEWCMLTPRRCAMDERKQDDRSDAIEQDDDSAQREVAEEVGLRLRAEDSQDESEEHNVDGENDASEEDETVVS
jgi:8-oxo-dGTP pyrophosphatase MutT (NUDIX family)